MHQQHLIAIDETQPVLANATLSLLGIAPAASSIVTPLPVRDGIALDSISLNVDDAVNANILLRGVQLGISFFADEALTQFINFLNVTAWQGAFEPVAAGQSLAWAGELVILPQANLPANAVFAMPTYECRVRNADAVNPHNALVNMRALMRAYQP